MRAVAAKLLDALASLKLGCVLLLLLGLLTWLGTLEQTREGLFEVQRRYFESYVLVHRAGPVPIPLPGANLVMSLLFVNLMLGGVLRLRRGAATAGVLVAHLGIALLLVAGFVKLHHSAEGHVTLYEGQSAGHFQSWHRWELAIVEDLGGGRVREHLVPQELFEDAGERARVLESAALPFWLEVARFAHNSRPALAAPGHGGAFPAVDGCTLRPLARLPQNEANIAGLAVAAVDADGRRQEGLLWGAQAHPWTVTSGGRAYGVDLRRERHPMPFTIALADFTKVDHPGTSMPASFESDVEVRGAAGARELTISMNEPLREEGLVVYQASWGPSSARPGERLFSTFAVVRNPGERLPLAGCVVIAAGLLLHFTRKLVRWMGAEARRA